MPQCAVFLKSPAQLEKRGFYGGIIVGYLARSTSAFYALLGGLLLVLSFDVRRHRTVLTYLGIAISLLGLILLFVDWVEGLPPYWRTWEGPFVFLLGLAVLFLNRRIGTDATA